MILDRLPEPEPELELEEGFEIRADAEAGRRDSTSERSESHASALHPSKLSASRFGQIHSFWLDVGPESAYFTGHLFLLNTDPTIREN